MMETLIILQVFTYPDLLKIYVDKDNQDRKLRDVEDTVLFKPYCIPETKI